jgi:catechol 2,3-dioxygenase-like lactoylglutathione lyase family enzyme
MRATIEAVHPVLAARDVAESVRFFARLGFAVVFRDDPEAPRYAAVARDGIELHLQWADAGQWVPGVDRPALRFRVDDVDALHAEWVAAGVAGGDASAGSPWAAPGDTPWGTREFHLRDPGGSSLQFYRPR